MIINFYTIYDNKQELYHPPFQFDNDKMAIRYFSDLANDDTTIAKHPEDYSLFWCGQFENDTGENIGQKNPVHLANAHEHAIQSKKTK